MDPRIAVVIEHLQKNVERDCDVATIAAGVNLSPSRLRALFRAETATSLSRYVRENRLQHSQHLLLESFLSVKQVAAACGFRSVSHFVRLFARAYGTSPSIYRQRTVKKSNQ